MKFRTCDIINFGKTSKVYSVKGDKVAKVFNKDTNTLFIENEKKILDLLCIQNKLTRCNDHDVLIMPRYGKQDLFDMYKTTRLSAIHDDRKIEIIYEMALNIKKS